MATRSRWRSCRSTGSRPTGSTTSSTRSIRRAGPDMAGLTLTRIGKSFGAVPVLNDIDLDIADGEFLTLVGPSGCGKSTLLRIIAGLEPQDRGTVAIGGAPVD